MICLIQVEYIYTWCSVWVQNSTRPSEFQGARSKEQCKVKCVIEELVKGQTVGCSRSFPVELRNKYKLQYRRREDKKGCQRRASGSLLHC
jgi:hypothetical protein